MDFQDYPQNQDQKTIPWKLIAIIGGGIIIAIVLVIIAFRVFGSSNNKISFGNNISDKTSNKTLSTQETEKSCEALKDKAKDNCYWGIANDKADETVCKKVIDVSWQEKCIDGIRRDIAISKSDIALCDKIKDDQTKLVCTSTIEGPITSANCASRGKDSAYCDMMNVSDKAIKAQDPSLCDKLNDNLKALCHDMAQVDDPDFDGLDSHLETTVYHTDPRKADTDGDGYSDGDEIKTGHNPLAK